VSVETLLRPELFIAAITREPLGSRRELTLIQMLEKCALVHVRLVTVGTCEGFLGIKQLLEENTARYMGELRLAFVLVLEMANQHAPLWK
jgi:hypothetical protein